MGASLLAPAKSIYYNHFAPLWRVLRQTPLSRVELSKSPLKGFGLQKGALLPLLRQPVKTTVDLLSRIVMRTR